MFVNLSNNQSLTFDQNNLEKGHEKNKCSNDSSDKLQKEHGSTSNLNLEFKKVETG